MQMKGASKMAGLFLYAAMIQGAIAVMITFLGALGDQFMQKVKSVLENWSEQVL